MNERLAAGDTARVIAEIEEADARRVAATLAKDASTLERVLADDLRYVHSSGTDEDKRTFIERATTGHYDYRELTTIRRDFRVYGEIALVNGDVRIEVLAKGTHKRFVSRYLQVWRRAGEGWQMSSWQSTPMPA